MPRKRNLNPENIFNEIKKLIVFYYITSLLVTIIENKMSLASEAHLSEAHDLCRHQPTRGSENQIQCACCKPYLVLLDTYMSIFKNI